MMQSRRILVADMRLIVVVRSLFIAVWLAMLPVAGRAGETGTISGRVLSPRGKPVAGAVITLPHPDKDKPPLATAHANEDGRFRFQLGEMEPRLYSPPLMIRAEGFASTYIDKRHIVSFRNADRDLGVVQLSDGRIYSGRIVDTSDQPLAGATVTYSVHRFLGRGSSDFIDGPHEVTTDPEGRFATPPLPDGVPLIRVSAHGFVSSAFGLSSIKQAADGAIEVKVKAAQVTDVGSVKFQN